MSAESFYGGRIGASFIIVKRFDAISVEKNTQYKEKIYAVDENGVLLYTNNNFIEKTAETYKQGYYWTWVTLDGSTVDTIDPDTGIISQQVLSIEYQEGMVQCFMQGGDTTDIVNYGEYVIIDAINNDDPDNGKVYRRGMNFDYDPDTNPLAGAEYIGQIVGPSGESPELGIEKEKIIKEHSGYRSGSYTKTDEDLVPGYGVDGYDFSTYLGTYYLDVYAEILNNVTSPQVNTLYRVTNGTNQEYEYFIWDAATGWTSRTPAFNDDITYSWVTVRDANGHVQGCLIGFTTPYLVHTFIANPVSAYYHRDSEGIPFRNMNLIDRIDDGSHPYYQSWKINVPEGIKGESITKLEKIDTQARSGAVYYYNQGCTDEAGTLDDFLNLDIDNIDYTLDYIPIIIRGETYYIKNNGLDTCTSILRYTATDYHRKAEGDKSFVSIGSYNIIKDIWIEPNGDVYVNYSYDNIQKLSGTHLRWINNMVINQNGDYIITYNDGTTDTGNIHFIDNIHIDADGTVHYYYSNGDEATKQEKLIRWIDDVDLDAENGNGTQQIIITYNNEYPDHPKKEAIGDPINYILEVAITESRTESPQTPPFHLLVLYADPIRRAEVVSKGENALYRAVRTPDISGNYLRNDWHDLGNVRGAKGGIGLLCKLSNINDLNDDSASPVPIPPEYMMEAVNTRKAGNPYILNPPVGLDTEHAGWLVGIDIATPLDPYAMDVYFYDYTLQNWLRISSFGAGGADPAEVVRISDIDIVPASPDLEEDGIWFVTEACKLAN